MQPRDDQVLVVARVADDRRAVRPTREVLEEAAAFELELDAVGRVVQLLLGHRPGPVDRIQVQRRRAVVARRLWFGRLAKPGVGIEGHVVVEELAEERRPRRVVGVVGVVGAQRLIDDQLLGPGLERVLGVEQAAGPAQLAQRRLDLRALLRERWQSEDPTEVLGRQEPPPARRGRSRRRRRRAAGIERRRAGARPHRSQESPAAQSMLVVRGHRHASSARPRARAARDRPRAHEAAGRDEQRDEGLHDNPRCEDEQTDASTVGPRRAANICRTTYFAAPQRRICHAARYSDGGVARLEPRLRRPRGRAGRARRRDGGGTGGHAGPRARGRRGRRGQEPARRRADRVRQRRRRPDPRRAVRRVRRGDDPSAARDRRAARARRRRAGPPRHPGLCR